MHSVSKGHLFFSNSQVRDLREYFGALYKGEYVSYSVEYYQNFLTFLKGVVSGQTNFIVSN